MDDSSASASAHLLSEEQIVLSKLNSAFRGDEVKINMIVGAWPHPRTLKSFVESFTNGYPPQIWDNLNLSEDDYKQVKSVIDSIHLEQLQRNYDKLQRNHDELQRNHQELMKKLDRMVCHLM